MSGRAIIYNEYLDQLGGGERSTLAFDRALRDLGYETEIVSTRPTPAVGVLCDHFGEEFGSARLRRVPMPQLSAYLEAPDVRLFVNHTFMSFLRNRAPFGIYAQMFPVRSLRHGADAFQIEALRTYDVMLCNSRFTMKYTRRRWDGGGARQLAVVNPPIGDAAAAAAASFAQRLPGKTKQFAHVGRFSPALHSKNQHAVIEAFFDACAADIRLRDWRLVLIGTVGGDDVSRRYYGECEALAERAGGRVVLRPNVPARELDDTLADSFAYVHATGAFLPHGEQPERCEHFGLAIAEAMARGCLVLAYGRGGIWDIAQNAQGVTGYLTPEELRDGFCRVAAIYGSDTAGPLQRDNRVRALTVDYEHFKNRLAAFLPAGCDPTQPAHQQLTSAPTA